MPILPPNDPPRRERTRLVPAAVLVLLASTVLAGQDILRNLRNLGEKQDYRSRRVSSYDRGGGNRDSIVIEPGKTAVLAEIQGPAAIDHIWVTIDHDHTNDRSDFLSSIAYWYQAEPHRPFPPLAPAAKRLPFAFEPPENFVLPNWELEKPGLSGVYVDHDAGLRMSAPRLAATLSSYYNAAGSRYLLLRTDGAAEGTRVEFRFPVEIRDLYAVELHFLKGPGAGNFRILRERPGKGPGGPKIIGNFEGYSGEAELGSVTLNNLLLEPGLNTLFFQAAGKDGRAVGADVFFVGFGLKPAARRFIRE